MNPEYISDPEFIFSGDDKNCWEVVRQLNIQGIAWYEHNNYIFCDGLGNVKLAKKLVEELFLK